MVLLPLSLFFPIHGSSQALGLDLVELNGQRHGKVAVSTALKLELFWPLFIPQGFTVSGFNCNQKSTLAPEVSTNWLSASNSAKFSITLERAVNHSQESSILGLDDPSRDRLQQHHEDYSRHL
jgi:hypothetical protein